MKLEPGTILNGTDLSDVDFSELDLSGATFDACTIVDANVSGTCFEGARFSKCSMIRSRFANVDFRDAIFEDCSFADDQGHIGAQFAFSRVEEARFYRCDLSFAKFERSELYGVEIETCNLRGAVFKKVDFARAFGSKVVKWAGAIKGCNLELADLAELRMPDCDLNNSRFREAVLFDADFEGADLRGCDFVQALTAGAKFARADMRGADLSGMSLVELGSFARMMVSADQQYLLLAALGVDVFP